MQLFIKSITICWDSNM